MSLTIDLPSGVDAAINAITCRILTRLSNYDDESSSPDNQAADCEAHVVLQRARLGRDGVTVYYDPALHRYHDYASGYDELAERPELERLLNDLRPGDLVLVWKLDRLARNTFRLLGLLREIHQRGASVYFLNESINSLDASGQITITVLAALAEAESRNTSIRVKRAKAEATGVGAYIGGPVPYGWRVERRGAHLFLELDPETSGLLMEIVDWFLNERINVNEAVARLNAKLDRYKTPSCIEYERQVADWIAHGRDITKIKLQPAARWNTKTLKAILTSPLMVGKSLGSVVVAPKGRTRLDGKGMRKTAKRIKRLNTDPATGEDLISHAPLLDQATYDRLQLRLHDTATGPQKRRRNGGARLGSLVICGDCGKPCYGPSQPRPGNDSYLCRTKGRDGGCGGNSIAARSLEALMRLLVIVTLSRPGLLDGLIARYEQDVAADAADPLTDPNAAERHELTGALARLEAAKKAGDYKHMPGIYEQMKHVYEEKLSQLRLSVPTPRQPALDLRIFRGKPIAEVWDGLSRNQQLAVWEHWIERIELAPLAHDERYPTKGTKGSVKFDPTRLHIVWRHVTPAVSAVPVWELPAPPAPAVAPVRCGDCTGTFASAAALRSHAAKAHPRHVACKLCSTTFASSATLTQHMDTDHRADRLCCPTSGCQRTFSMRAHLVSHQRTH